MLLVKLQKVQLKTKGKTTILLHYILYSLKFSKTKEFQEGNE